MFNTYGRMEKARDGPVGKRSRVDAYLPIQGGRRTVRFRSGIGGSGNAAGAQPFSRSLARPPLVVSEVDREAE